MTAPLFDISEATFSPCRRYRYTLTRRWSDGPTINFLMLNPSTADEVENDPTVERCERRARMWNFGSLVVTNLFSWRATDPRELRKVEDPIGPDNDEAIREVAYDAQTVVCAWGRNGQLFGRGEAVRKRLHSFRTLHYLRISPNTGQPEHPLYIGYDVKPTVWGSA